jgi:hypothetical protein
VYGRSTLQATATTSVLLVVLLVGTALVRAAGWPELSVGLNPLLTWYRLTFDPGSEPVVGPTLAAPLLGLAGYAIATVGLGAATAIRFRRETGQG